MSAKVLYRSLVGIGSNLGDRMAHVESAIEGLKEISVFIRVSDIYETAPVGALSEQGRYLNLVALLVTPLDPDALLDQLAEIERRNQRVRGEINAARTLDLDVLYVYGYRSETKKLQVPHPRMAERAFVIAPLLDVDPVVAYSLSPGLADSISRRARTVGDEVADGVVFLGHYPSNSSG